MHNKILLIILLWLPLTGLVVAQEKAVVFDFEAIGVDEQTCASATHIFRNELDATGKFLVMAKGDMEAKLTDQGITDFSCYEITCAASNGFALGVEKAIIGSLTKLGERITAEVRLVDVIRKEVEFTDRFSATSLDDLDSALRKLAKAVASRQKIESEVTRYAITEEETQEPRRKKSYITSGASFGFGFPLGDSYAKVSNLKTLAWVMRYEAGNLVIDNSVGITWGKGGEQDTVYDWSDNATVVDKKQVVIMPWDIGVRYVFNRESDFTPFVGGGIGLHFISSQEVSGLEYTKSDQAMALHVAGGFYAFQSYDFRLTIEGKYTIVFTDAFGKESGNSSQQFGISIGISRKFEKEEKRGCLSGGCVF
jgi:hypothetical protein